MLVRVARVEQELEAERVWENELMRSDVSTSVLLDGHVYGFDRGTLKCLDVRTSEIKWRTRARPEV